MNKLKELRLAAGKTQADVAKLLNTTQQTYARWEGGKVSPPLSVLRDLSVLFDTTVDYILGRGPVRPATTRYHLLTDEADGFWGHLGLLWPGVAKTTWYPITAGEAGRLRCKLADVEPSTWIVVETLNNRVLVFRPTEAKRIWLLDDACDQPADDWDWKGPWDDYSGIPLEIYKAMADWVDDQLGGHGDFETNNSPAMRKTALAMIKEGGFLERPEDLDAIIRQTAIHLTDGSIVKYVADQSDLENVVMEFDGELHTSMIELSADGGDFESFYSVSTLRMIEAPMIALETGSPELRN